MTDDEYHNEVIGLLVGLENLASRETLARLIEQNNIRYERAKATPDAPTSTIWEICADRVLLLALLNILQVRAAGVSAIVTP